MTGTLPPCIPGLGLNAATGGMTGVSPTVWAELGGAGLLSCFSGMTLLTTGHGPLMPLIGVPFDVGRMSGVR